MHSKAVAEYAGALARRYADKHPSVVRTGENFVERVRAAAQLHDLGKIDFPDYLFTNYNANGEAPNDPRRIRRHKHPQIGYNILYQNPKLRSIAQSVRGHHEFWNGNGYPDKLSGEAIPLEARIIKVADVWDAMTSNRPYRKPLPFNEAVRELKEQRGKVFDPELVDLFTDPKFIDNTLRPLFQRVHRSIYCKGFIYEPSL